ADAEGQDDAHDEHEHEHGDERERHVLLVPASSTRGPTGRTPARAARLAGSEATDLSGPAVIPRGQGRPPPALVRLAGPRRPAAGTVPGRSLGWLAHPA